MLVLLDDGRHQLAQPVHGAQVGVASALAFDPGQAGGVHQDQRERPAIGEPLPDAFHVGGVEKQTEPFVDRGPRTRGAARSVSARTAGEP